MPPGINPVSWWHDLEGGTVAEQRPPPPNAGAPYPNLATVPPKPTPPEPAMRARIANALIADRANAQYAAAQTPIPVPAPLSSGPAAPSLFGGAVPPAPAADPDASTASLPAASAAPRPAAAPSKPAPVPQAGAPQAGAPQAGAAAPPVIAEAPPPPPILPGVAIPVTAPTPPPAAPAAAPPGPRVATAGDTVPVAFPPGSAILPAGSDGALKRLIAAGKGAKGIAVTGFGESNSTSPAAQVAAVRLGLLRAEAIAAVFGSAGVPPAMLRINAQASGTGGEARLID